MLSLRFNNKPEKWGARLPWDPRGRWSSVRSRQDEGYGTQPSVNLGKLELGRPAWTRCYHGWRVRVSIYTGAQHLWTVPGVQKKMSYVSKTVPPHASEYSTIWGSCWGARMLLVSLCWGEDLLSTDAWMSTVHHPLKDASLGLQALSSSFRLPWVASSCPAALFNSPGYLQRIWVLSTQMKSCGLDGKAPVLELGWKWTMEKVIKYSPKSCNIIWKLVKDWKHFPIHGMKKSTS